MNFQEVEYMENDLRELGELLELGKLRRPPAPKIFRPRTNYFQILSEEEFTKRFRLNKNTVLFLHGLIEDQIKPSSNRNHAVSSINRLLLTLRFYATGSYMLSMSDFSGVSKTSAVNFTSLVTTAIASLRETFIYLPRTIEEKRRAKGEFLNIASFPRVIGALDCTHIRLLSPGGDYAEVFRNRKGYFSLNCQTVSDAQLKIRDVVVRWPGSTNDQTIFNNSRLMHRFESGEFINCILVGDSGYECRDYVLTPLSQVDTPAEQLYNEAQIRTRNVVERQYGVWKRRFPVLSLGLRVSLQKSMEIIVATAICHNIAIEMNNPLPPDNNEELEHDLVEVVEIPRAVENRNAARQLLIETYFQNLVPR